MEKLFGTDGIRGVAGSSPLTKREIRRLGLAAGHVLRKKFPGEKIRVLAVRDTRASGEWILDSLSSGLINTGIQVFNAGILSTPSVAHLVKAHRFHSGIVISASHNPPAFNGIKFFNSHGFKWPDTWEAEVESLFRGKKLTGEKSVTGLCVGAALFSGDYEDFLRRSLEPEMNFSGLSLAIDCSNGANSHTAPELFRKLGAKVFAMGAAPNGKNINVSCGSQSTSRLAELVRRKRCQVGIAFDGDGDRVIMVDEKGSPADGDHLIALLARDFLKRGILKKKLVVITVMANLGLKRALGKLGIKTIETPVGDRHVSEAMRHHGAVLGGEQSGHIILGQHLSSGDGLLTALHVISALKKEKKPFSQLIGWMHKYPQVLLNVPVKEKRPLAELNGVHKKIKSIEQSLGSDGRLLVRYSGTEPLLRIMLEGPSKTDLDQMAKDLASDVLASFR